MVPCRCGIFFSCSTRQLIRSLRLLVSYRVKHWKRIFIFMHAHLFSIYHINCGVIQGFPALRKAVTTHVKKYRFFFFHVCWYSQSAAYTSLACCATRSGWGMKGKAFTILNTSCLSELSWIMATKTLKNPYRWQTMRFKLSWEGTKTNTLKEKSKVAYSVALVLAFLSAENENRQLEDLPLADFGRLPERLLLSVSTKSINENFVNWKLRQLLFL